MSEINSEDRILVEKIRKQAADAAKAKPKRDPLSCLLSLSLTDELVRDMADAEHLIKDFIIKGHMAAYIAPGNGGKTTLFVHFCEALTAKGYNVVYCNLDGSADDLKRHHAHATAYGYTVVSPDAHIGYNVGDVAPLLAELSESDQPVDDLVIIIDTLKKLVDVIQKKAAKDFYQTLRKLSARGATICCLGHANKYKDSQGKLVYEGTADLRNDFDELIYLYATKDDATQVIEITTDPDKVRASIKPRSFRIHLADDRRVEEVSGTLKVISKESREIRRLVIEAIGAGNFVQSQIISYVHERIAEGKETIRREILDMDADKQLVSKRGSGKSLIYSLPGYEDIADDAPLGISGESDS